ncbi:MAG TPA: homoserine dehydrogenase [Blastocatellia bacterium]|nr:homoserine dehydrogenase [Blastocatellia bacterium]
MAKITLGILGLGTVGTGVVKLLSNDPRFKIKWAAVRDTSKLREIEMSSVRVTDQPFDIVNDPEVEIVIEVAGGITPIYDLIKRAIEKGKHVVTANKELIATHGSEIFELADRHNVTVLFEAAVGGGIPLISTIQRGLQANEISSVAGILNGTTNYILTAMEDRGLSFDDALAEAQRLGFAEADPTNDVEAFDVAYKITILASLAFGRFVNASGVYRQGITLITDQDIRIAAEFGYRIKLIGLARRGDGCLDVRAHPMLVPVHHLLASVEGANNAIFISGSAVGEVMLVGPGAGQMPTASAVVGDLINLASALKLQDFAPYFQPPIESREAPLCPIEDSDSAFYIRLETNDIPGVIGNIGHALGGHQVSLHSLLQRGVTEDGGATIVLLTHRSGEHNVAGALREIEAQATTRRINVALRVWGLV